MSVVYVLGDPFGKQYVGATVNLKRRLRQHRREISGGAKKTSRGGPWSVLCFIYGFKSWKETLRFEYVLQHPHKSKLSRNHVKKCPKRGVSLELIEICIALWERPLGIGSHNSNE